MMNAVPTLKLFNYLNCARGLEVFVDSIIGIKFIRTILFFNVIKSNNTCVLNESDFKIYLYNKLLLQNNYSTRKLCFSLF